MPWLRAHALCLSAWYELPCCTENGKFPMAKGRSRVSKTPAKKNSVRVKVDSGPSNEPMVMLKHAVDI